MTTGTGDRAIEAVNDAWRRGVFDEARALLEESRKSVPSTKMAERIWNLRHGATSKGAFGSETAFYDAESGNLHAELKAEYLRHINAAWDEGQS